MPCLTLFAPHHRCFVRDGGATHALLSGTRRIVDVVFSFTNRNTDVTEKYFVRVDVTEEFPFLVTTMSPFYER